MAGILTQAAHRPRIRHPRARQAPIAGKEKTGGACPIGASGPGGERAWREGGGSQPRSSTNGRPGCVNPKEGRRLRKAYLRAGRGTARAGYIDSGAEIPRSPRLLASVVFAAATSASRAADRSGSSGSTTRASR